MISLASVRRFVQCVPIAAALAACGGGVHTAPPGPPALAHGSSPQTVTLEIDVPKNTGAAYKRRPQYISPATTQIAVNVQSGCPGACVSASGFPKTAGLTPTSTGCVSTLASTECTLTLALAAGTYVGTLTTLDASGVALSAATSVPMTITQGVTNTIAVTLSGIPSAIGTSVVATGGPATTMLVYALDADGDIIAGSGAPTFAITQSGSPVTLTQPTPTSPNTFTVAPQTNGASTTQLAITASYPAGGTNACALSGAVCTASPLLNVNGVSALVVGNFDGDPAQEYALPGGSSLGAIANDGQSAPAVAFDSENNLWVTELSRDFSEFAPPYTGSAIRTFSESNGTAGVAFDTQQNLFVCTNFQIDEYAAPYTGAPIASIQMPCGPIALDASGDLFTIDFSSSAVEMLSPPYSGTPVQMTTGLDFPTSVAIGPNGDLYVVNSSGSVPVAEFRPPFTGAPLAPISYSVPAPYGITFDANGDLFLSSDDGTKNDDDPGHYDSVDEFAPPYSGAPTQTLTIGLFYPAGMAARTAFTVTIGS